MDTITFASESPSRETGEVVAFYSYKGGTGRTMAMVNSACLLARRGQGRVLLIDWDLEAPGLHHYFAKQEHDTTGQQGLLELVSDAWRRLQASAAIDNVNADSIWPELNITEYIAPTGIKGIEYIRAGEFDESYGNRLSEVNWRALFQRCPELFPALSRYLTLEYRWVLIDARTGTTDTTGICTMLMPDKLVVVFSPNRQSIEGITALTRRAVKWREQYGETRPLLVYPLPSRIDSERESLRQIWRHGDESDGIVGYQPLFERALADAYGLARCSLESYFNEVQVQHAPDFAYGERIAVHESQTGVAEDRFSIARSYEALLDWLVEGIPPWEDRDRWRAMAEMIRVEESLDAIRLQRKGTSESSGTQVVELCTRRWELAARVHGAESSDANVALIKLAAAHAEFINPEQALTTLARHPLDMADTDVSALQAMSDLAKALLLAGQPEHALSWAARARDGLDKTLGPNDRRSVVANSIWFSAHVRLSERKLVHHNIDIPQRLVSSITYPLKADHSIQGSPMFSAEKQVSAVDAAPNARDSVSILDSLDS